MEWMELIKDSLIFAVIMMAVMTFSIRVHQFLDEIVNRKIGHEGRKQYLVRCCYNIPLFAFFFGSIFFLIQWLECS